jgi:hypothetical protein
VSSDRCPACAAAVPIGAPWCTLCFADLRPKPVAAPEPEPVHAVAPAPVPVSVGAASAPVDLPLPPDPILDAPVMRAPKIAGNRAATWPCTGCGVSVPIEEMACPACGAGFLAREKVSVSLRLPGVGDITQLSGSGRIMLMAGGCTVVTFVLFIVYLVLGHLV